MDPIGPGNHDRAWNDPPKFAFNASSAVGQSGPGGRRRLLNKRVPVPIGSMPANTTAPVMRPIDTPPTKGSLPLGPPPTTTIGSLPSHLKNPNINISKTGNMEDNKTSQEMLQELEMILNNSLEALSEKLKDNMHEEISRRMAMMKGMWEDEKFNSVVMKRILSMVRAMGQAEYDSAWALHQGLIVDYTSLCSPWMVGVKMLITESRNSKSEENEEQENNVESKGKVLGDLNSESSCTEVFRDEFFKVIPSEQLEPLSVAELSISKDITSDEKDCLRE